MGNLVEREPRSAGERSTGPFADRPHSARLETSGLFKNLEPGSEAAGRPAASDSSLPPSARSAPERGKVSQRDVGEADSSCDGWG